MAQPSEQEALSALGERLRTLRDARQMTQQDLAEAAATHWTYVGQVERGKRNPSYLILRRLAAALGTTVGRLVDGS